MYPLTPAELGDDFELDHALRSRCIDPGRRLLLLFCTLPVRIARKRLNALDAGGARPADEAALDSGLTTVNRRLKVHRAWNLEASTRAGPYVALNLWSQLC